MQTVDPAVAGGAFQAVTPPTTVQQVPAGGVPIVDPDESQTVMQQVAPVTYQDVVPTAGSGTKHSCNNYTNRRYVCCTISSFLQNTVHRNTRRSTQHSCNYQP